MGFLDWLRGSSTQDELSSTKAELSSTKAELSTAKAELSSTKAELSSTKSELSHTKAELSSTKAELSSIKGELSSTKAELSSELSSTKAELSLTKAELSSNKVSLRDTKEEIEKLKKDIIGLEILITNLYKVGELQEQIFSTKIEALVSKFDLEISEKEVEELKDQVLTRTKFEEDIDIKLKTLTKLEKQVSIVNDEVFSTTSSLEELKNEENMLKQQLLTQERFQKDIEMKLEMIMKLEKQLLYIKDEALSTKCDFEASKMEENMLKEQLQSCEAFIQDIEMKLRKVMEFEKKLKLARAETLFVKVSLEASKKQEKKLKKKLLEVDKYQKDMELKLQKMLELQGEISHFQAEGLSSMASLETSKKEVEELKEKLSALEKIQQALMELRLT